MPDELTPLQERYLEVADTALALGVLAAGLIVFLLAVIAVRGLSSWK